MLPLRDYESDKRCDGFHLVSFIIYLSKFEREGYGIGHSVMKRHVST